MSFDLLPWETLPEAPEHATETIAWNGGELVLSRLGYLTVDELQGIRAIDPQNSLYRLITAAAVELHQAVQSEEFSAHRCYGLLTRLLAQEQGANIGRLSPEEGAVQVLHAGIIGPFLEEALGKLQEVSNSTATDPTGPEPSGIAAGSGPEPPSSPASGSGSSPAATSSRRSKRDTAPNGIASTGKRRASPRLP